MKTFQASYDQNDPRFGHRAGSQCMSNCFTFLHAVFVEGITTALSKSVLDGILEQGRILDSSIYDRLSNAGSCEIHQYRLVTEIPRVLDTSFGMTGHSVSRPFSGTLETLDLDGYVCMGIFDFILHANQKIKPTYVIITVGCVTRAIMFCKSTTYIFDPHPTQVSDKAAVYQCDAIEETVNLITGFGTTETSFYYDAYFVYFINLSDSNTSVSEIDAMVVQNYPDSEISVPVMMDTSQTGDSGSPRKASKNSRKRNAYDNVPTKKTRVLNEDTLTFSQDEVLPSLASYEALVKEFDRQCEQYVIKGPPTARWILHGPSGLSFENEFLTDRMEQLIAYNLERFSSMTVKPPNAQSAVHKPRNIVLHQLRQLLTFSEPLDELIFALIKHDVNLISLYNEYTAKRSTLSHTDLILATKMLAVFKKWADEHGDSVKKWVKRLFDTLQNIQAKDIRLHIERFTRSNPLDINEPFVCLRKTDRDYVSDIVGIQSKKLDEKRAESEVICHDILNTILDMNTFDGTDGRVSNGKSQPTVKSIEAILKNVNTLDDEAMRELRQSAEMRFGDLIRDIQSTAKSVVEANSNRIVSGSMPVDVLEDLLSKMRTTIQGATPFARVNLCGQQYIDALRSTYDNVCYLSTGKYEYSDSNIADPIRTLRSNYDTSVSEHENDKAKIEDLLCSMEDTMSDVNAAASNNTMNMIKDQLRELDTLDLSSVKGAKQRKKAIQSKVNSMEQEGTRAEDFVKKLSFDGLSSVNAGLKNLPRLKPMLQEDAAMGSEYAESIMGILDECIRRLSEGNIPKDDAFSNINTLTNQLPVGDPKAADLRFATDLVSQLTRRLRMANVKSDAQDRLLLEAVSFFSSHQDDINKVMSAGYGAKFPVIYENVKKQVEAHALRDREAAWKELAKHAEITSQQDLNALTTKAPSEKVLEAELPDLKKRLQKHLDAQDAQRADIRKKQMADAKKKVSTDLKRVSTAFRSHTPSTASAVDLNVTESLLSDIDESSEIVENFNRDLMASLKEVESRIGDVESKLVQDIVQKTAPSTESTTTLNNAHISAELLSDMLARHHALLTQESEATIRTLLNEIKVATQMGLNWNDPPVAFKQTRYESPYKQYISLKDTISDRVAHVRDTMSVASSDITENIDSSPRKLGEKVAKVAPDTILTNEQMTQIDKIGIPAFKSDLQDDLRDKESIMKDEAAILNAKIKSKARSHDEKLDSAQARWQALIEQHRTSSAVDMDIDTEKLSSDPVRYMGTIVSTAIEKAPYMKAQRMLQWVMRFAKDVLAELKSGSIMSSTGSDSMGYTEMLSKASDGLADIEACINANALCERICAEIQENANTDEQTIMTLENALQQLEPKRVSGGEARYRLMLECAMYTKGMTACMQEHEILTKRYFELLDAIAKFSYGFDFARVQQLIEELKSAFTELSKKCTRQDQRDSAILPNPSISTFKSTSPFSFIRGLAAAAKYVTAQQSFLENLTAKQYTIMDSRDTVPVSLPPDNVGLGDLAFDEMVRLMLSKSSAEYYQVLNIFGDRQTVSKNGIPIQLSLTYGNVMHKLFTLRREPNLSARKVSTNTVTARYKSLTVTTDIILTTRAFWNQITAYDLKPMFLAENASPVKREAYILANLKLCVYLLVSAWTSNEDEPDTTDSEQLPLSDFFTLMATAHPEYVYSAATNPICTSLIGLMQKIDKQSIFKLLNDTDAVPHSTDTRAFCIDPKQWSQISFKRYMWDTDIFKQLCDRDVGFGHEETGKLLQYSLAVMILPSDVLQHVWTQFRPIYAKSVDTIFDFVRQLYDSFASTKNISRRTVSDEQRLPSGEKIFQIVTVREKPTEDYVMLRDFLSKESVLDYMLGSYVFGIQAMFAVHISDITSLKRRLLLRSLDNVTSDVDFTNIIKSRNLNISTLPDTVWTGNLIEHSWFTLQVKKLKDVMQNPATPSSVPLIIYDAADNYVKWTLSHNAAAGNAAVEQPIRFHICNPYPAFPIDESRITMDVPDFSRIPTSTEFLYKAPPDLYPEPPVDQEAYGSIPDSTQQCPDDGSPLRSTDDSVDIYSVNDPLFQYSTSTQPIPMDDLTTVSPWAAMEDFVERPIYELGRNIELAIGILAEVRAGLQSLYEEVHETIRRIKVMYIY